jgi:MFS family permease
VASSTESTEDGTDPLGGGPISGRLSYRGGILLFVSIGWFLFNSGRLLLPPLAVPIQDALAIGDAGFGFAITVLWAMYALLQFPSGISTDTIGYRTVLVGSLAVIGPAFAILSFAGYYWVFLVVLALVGAGGSYFYIVSRTLPAELYGDRKGRAIGLVTAAGNASGVLAPLAATAIIAFSWRAPFAVIGVALLLVGVVFHFLVRGTYAFEFPDVRGASTGATAEITKRGVPMLLVAYSTFAIAWQGSTAFIPLYFYRAKGFDLATANAALALFFLMGVFVKPAAGWISDAIGRRVVSSGTLFGAGVSLAVLALVADSRLWVLVVVVVYGATLLSFSPVMQAYLIEIFDDDNNASSFGLARTLYVLVGSTGPTLVGIGSETIGFTSTFAIVSIGLVGGAILLWVTTGRLDIEATS